MDMDNDEDEKIFWKSTSDRPVNIHLHSNLGTSVSATLSKKIKRYGGNPKATEKDAEVIICRREGPVFKFLTKKYDHDRYKWVEPPSWVDYCISEKKYEHPSRPPLLRRPVTGRTEFTPAEDTHIVHFLAKRIPYKTMKGRAGNKVWQDLCERTDLYPWTTKHTWHSWRERYVKNKDVFDERIEKVVLADPDPPTPGSKGQYRVEFRKPAPRNRPRVPYMEEEEEEEFNLDEALVGSEGTNEDAVTPPTKRRRIDREPEPSKYREEEEEEEEGEEHNARNMGSSQLGPPSRIRTPLLQANPSVSSSSPPPDSEKEAHANEREVAATTSQSSPRQQPSASAPQPSSKRRVNESSNVPLAVPQRNHPTVANPHQATTSLNDEDNAPPAFRTRARRQASLDPPTQPALSTRIRTRRAAATPPPPPPPTRATQPEEIDLTQLSKRKRDARKPKPALIPIPEVPEDISKVINDDRESVSHDEMAIEEFLQRSYPEIKSLSDDDDGDEIDQLDLDSDSDNFSSMLNEGVKAIAERANETHVGEADQDITPKAMPASVRRARKIPLTQPLPFDPSGNDLEESSEDSQAESGSGDEDTGSEAQTGVESLDTQTSVPAVGTIARKYVNARMPFTPARGTLAEEHVSSSILVKRTLSRPADKGKGRAR